MVDHVPNEIIMNILSNLPVKSLLRLKCVSKPWNSLISSPKFQLSNQRRQGAIAIVSKRYEDRKKSESESIAFRFISQQLTLRERKFPFVIRDDGMHVGSCHGLILVCINKHIYLWNPATQFCTKVLELDRLDECGYYTRGGLCFDSSENVYKAVLLMRHQTPDYGGEFVIVASLKDKRWRRVRLPYDIRLVCDGISLHGRIHYRVRVKWDSFGPCKEIIYFDPISETFHMFPVPAPKTDQGEYAIVGLGVLNECLSMACLKDDKGGVEILVMNEYGVKESWTSLFFIRKLEINPSHGIVMPFFVTGDGELVLMIYDHDEKIVVYNPKNDNTQNLHIRGEKVSMCDTINYVESLISPKEYYWSSKRHKKFGQLNRGGAFVGSGI